MNLLKDIIKSALVEADSELVIFESSDGEGLISKKSGKQKLSIKEDINNWSNRDFALYVLKKYKDKKNINWNINIIALTTRFSIIGQNIQEVLGFCDNLTIKNYIDFFFEKWFDILVNENKDKKLHFSNLYNDKCVLQFVNNYCYSSFINNDTKPIIKKTVEKKDREKISLSTLKNSYVNGIDKFLEKFGYIVSINFIIHVLKEDPKASVKKIAEVLIELNSISKLDPIIIKTVEMGPYPEWFTFKKNEEFLNILSKKISKKINADKVEFSTISIWEK